MISANDTYPEKDTAVSAPPLWVTACEFPRALQEMAMLLPSHRRLKKLPQGDGHPIIVIPGFSADNKTTAILRRYLNHWGYAAEAWEMDQNINPRDITDFDDVVAFKERMIDVVGQRIQALHESSGKKVTLIGWSLGGIFSRILASHHQDYTRHVVTLGTPFGDPRTVPIYPLMEKILKKPMSQRHLDAWLDMCHADIGEVNLSILYSKSDGFVSRDIASNTKGATQQAIHVCSSHVGFAVNPSVLYLLAHRLNHEEDEWEKLKPHNKLSQWLYRYHQ